MISEGMWSTLNWARNIIPAGLHHEKLKIILRALKEIKTRNSAHLWRKTHNLWPPLHTYIIDIPQVLKRRPIRLGWYYFFVDLPFRGMNWFTQVRSGVWIVVPDQLPWNEIEPSKRVTNLFAFLLIGCDRLVVVIGKTLTVAFVSLYVTPYGYSHPYFCLYLV